MPDPAALDVLRRELSSLVTRVRGFSPTRLAAGAPPFGTKGDAAYHLAAELAGLAAAAEAIERRVPPRLGDFVLADQLAVLGNDLLAALDAAWDGDLACVALGEVVLHRRDLDGSTPGREAVAVLAAGYGCATTAGAVLLAATERCPGYPR